MSKLIVVSYDDELKAEQVRLDFLKMQKSYLVELEDAVVAVKKQDGKVKLRQMNNLTAFGALGGGFWGMLIGAIFLNPLLGFAIGGAAGAVSGALSDIGIDDNFMKQLAEQMKPGTSTLFILLHSDLSDKALAELKGTGGTIIQTSLASEDEEKLRKAISETGTEIK
ncbi:DUF1269 domain-containing protein [Mucispirillum schaedleri]|uniref:DUF1269 domain-containing protein n=1 Tax=Mucispirillum schaedleri TaxID=248039 RepID=UPI001F570447|nr:DUF1269 domain-containing protein [Mucispirillum schaedleri]